MSMCRFSRHSPMCRFSQSYVQIFTVYAADFHSLCADFHSPMSSEPKGNILPSISETVSEISETEVYILQSSISYRTNGTAGRD